MKQTRLYCIIARNAPRAVVFRRGPSKQVQLLLWNLKTDQFHEGQWFKGRIYERRCDLSPSGERLIYFAANYKDPYFSWTAVSRPPYLTAIALWPKGDAWGGGGLFNSETEIQLNHRDGEATLAPGFQLPYNVHIKPLGSHSGWGEDEPIMDMRTERDGWQNIQNSTSIERVKNTFKRLIPPTIYTRPNSKLSNKYELQMQVKGFGQINGAQYLIDYVVINKDTAAESQLTLIDWADWDQRGHLLFAKNGKLYRVPLNHKKLTSVDEARELIDLNDRTFTNCESPPEAKQWGTIK